MEFCSDNEGDVILDKKGLLMIREKKNSYVLNYELNNNNIDITKLLNFNLVVILQEVNKDIIIDYNIEIINENEANIYLLLKRIFEDLGFNQKYVHLNVKINKKENNTTFVSSLNEVIPSKVREKEWSLLPLNSVIIECDTTNKHSVRMKSSVSFDAMFEIPSFVEKFSAIIIGKVFLRIKQFIENYK
jgi:hypothetical protein